MSLRGEGMEDKWVCEGEERKERRSIRGGRGAWEA